MQEDARKWNRIFTGRPVRPPTPPEFISRQYQQLKPGNVLDVASGDGASALFLADRGFDVTAIDISSEGLNRLKAFAADRQLDINTRLIDLDLPNALSALETYDNIVICRFKPATTLWRSLVEHLAPGGFLALSTFNSAHHQTTGFPQRFCLEPEELRFVHPELELMLYETSQPGEAAVDSYLFQRR